MSETTNTAWRRHLLALAACALVVWLAKKDDPYVEAQSKEALNFNISMLIYAIALWIAGAALWRPLSICICHYYIAVVISPLISAISKRSTLPAALS